MNNLASFPFVDDKYTFKKPWPSKNSRTAIRPSIRHPLQSEDRDMDGCRRLSPEYTAFYPCVFVWVVRDGAFDTGDSRIPGIEDFAWFDLDFDYLSASVVDMRSNDETFLATVYSMPDGDDITRCDVLIRSGGHDRYARVR